MPTATDFPVKWLHSGMPRAPALTLSAGSLISVLDAFLVTGWGAITPQRIEVAGGTATVTCNSGDTFETNTVIEISGAEQPELNGQHRVLGSTATSFTFATDAADGFATGTISIKAAPAGWQKTLSAENQAVYRGSVLDAPLHYWHIDASDGYRAKVRGFAAMSAIDAGEYPFPPAGTNTFFWCGWQAGSGRQAYMLAADSAACIAALAATIGSFSSATSGHATFFLGALAPFAGAAGQAATDAAICGLTQWQQGNMAQGWHGAQWSLGRAGSYMAGTAAGYDGTERLATFYSAKSNITLGGVGLDGAPVLLPCWCYDAGGARGAVPGLFACAHADAAQVIEPFEFFQGGAALDGRLFVAVPCGHGAGWANDFAGFAFVDLSGPWR